MSLVSPMCISPQQVVLEHMVVWGGKGGKVIKVPFAIGAGTGCVYLAPFCKWSRDEPLSHLEWGRYFAQGKPIKAYTDDLGKRPNKGVFINSARQR